MLLKVKKVNPIKKPDIDEEKFGVNPFAFSLVIPARKIEFENQYRRDGEDDLLPVLHEVELTGYTKCYVSAERRLIKNKLSLRSKEMFLWIADELTPGKDYLWINKIRYMSENNISSVNTYKYAIEELVRYGFIANSTIKNVFWINPDFLFRGDRLKKYPKNVVLKNENND